MKKIVICSGGFDPLHSGHIEYLTQARMLGEYLIVGINSDEWLINKKGAYVLPWKERSKIVENLKMVSEILDFDDSDGTAIDLITKVQSIHPDAHVIFANGGDRTEKNIPEMNATNVEFIFGVGGKNKTNSSSSIMLDWYKRVSLKS
ncbi:MAG: adenylyltransferase/cytidyltransferase family protein [Gammaproteobacteria bacterium]